jgi:hypothetical protein
MFIQYKHTRFDDGDELSAIHHIIIDMDYITYHTDLPDVPVLYEVTANFTIDGIHDFRSAFSSSISSVSSLNAMTWNQEYHLNLLNGIQSSRRHYARIFYMAMYQPVTLSLFIVYCDDVNELLIVYRY